MNTIRDLDAGCTFKFFTRYKDGTRRPRFKYGSEKVQLRRAYLRVKGHALGPAVVEITRAPFDFTHELTVVEHLKNDVTTVRDEKFRLAPVYSGMRIQIRAPGNQPRQQQQHYAKPKPVQR